MIQGKIGDEGVVQTALRMPVSLRDDLRDEANRLGRSLNTHLVMTLREAAGGVTVQSSTPAAGNENAA